MRSSAALKKELDKLYKANKNNPKYLKKELRRYAKEGEESKNIFLIGLANYYLAHLSHRTGRRANILAYAIKAVTMFRQTTDYDMISRGYNLLGIGYIALEDYQGALSAYQMAYQTVCRHRNCPVGKDAIVNNIAECYYQMGDHKKSVKLTRECFEYAWEHHRDDPDSLGIYGVNLSDCYESAGELKLANEALDRTETIIGEIDLGIVVCAFYSRRACIAYLLGETEKGAAYADKLIEAVGRCHDTYELHRDFEKIAHEQIRLGDYDRANRFCDILLEYAESTGHVLDYIIAYRVQADFFKSVRDDSSALSHYAKLNELYEQRRDEEKAMHLATRKQVESSEREVRRLLRKIKESEKSAGREPLTGLLNRSALLTVAGEFVETAKRRKKKLGGIFIDVDFFKEYNDTYGHTMGDTVIRTVANACLKEGGANVRFARYGGDEFFALTLGLKDDELRKIAVRICSALRDAAIAHEKNPNGQRVTLSVGVANVDVASDSTILDIINCADKAVYQAKALGKNQICAFDGEHFDADGKRSPYIRVEY